MSVPPPTEKPPTPLAPYRVEQSGFEGPLELLLRLVERNSLPITEVSLAQVTDGYLRRVEELQAPPEEMSYFLVVASRLLLIKSRYLLPRAETESIDPSAEELAEQLRTYQRYRLAAAVLREREGRSCYLQLLPPPVPEPSPTPMSLPLAALERALRRSLARRTPLAEGPPLAGVRLRLSEVTARAEHHLRREGQVSLQQLAGPGAGRPETVVAFLAALDLVRRRRARAVQDGLFAPVFLYPAEEAAG